MSGDRTVGSVSLASSLELPRPLLRLLRRYATKVGAVRGAESDYRDVVLVESLRHGGKTKRASSKRIDAAFDALVDAIVDLQGARIELLMLAEDEGLSLRAVGALDEVFASAERRYASYLGGADLQRGA